MHGRKCSNTQSKRSHIVRVARGVTKAEDRDLFALEVETSEVTVDELIPGSTRALRIGAGVPSWCTNDQAVKGRNRGTIHITDVDGLEARRASNILGDDLSVSYEKEKRYENSGHINSCRLAGACVSMTLASAWVLSASHQSSSSR